MGRKDLERLVGKLRSMHLAVEVAVAHLYHIQRTLYQAGTDRAWPSPSFHQEIADWTTLADQTADRPTHLAEIVRCEPTHLGFCDASGLVCQCGPVRNLPMKVRRQPSPVRSHPRHT